MSPNLIRYLSLAYRRDVLGERGIDPLSAWHEDMTTEASRELARIERIPGDLSQRDFAAHQNRKALMRALGK
jgi:hypothetical protein